MNRLLHNSYIAHSLSDIPMETAAFYQSVDGEYRILIGLQSNNYIMFLYIKLFVAKSIMIVYFSTTADDISLYHLITEDKDSRQITYGKVTLC